MSYVPQLDDYVKWRNLEGWVYFKCDEYITIEIGVKDKTDDHWTKERTFLKNVFNFFPRYQSRNVYRYQTQKEHAGDN